MKKIAFLIYDLQTGGAERAVSNISNRLNKISGFEVFVMTISGEKPNYKIDSKLIQLNLDSKANIFSKFSLFIRRIKKLKKLKKQYKFDVVISFLPTSDILNIFTKLRFQKSIVSVRIYQPNQIKQDLIERVYDKLLKYTYKKADKIVAVTSVIKNQIISKYLIEDSKIIVIENAYDISEIKLLTQEVLNYNERHIFDKPVIICSGGLHDRKSQDLIIEAYSKIQNKEKYNLVILGSGVNKNKYIALSKELMVTENVFLLGHVKNPYKYLHRSIVFIMASKYEGFPNAMAEALICELPIISTNLDSGAREIMSIKKTVFKEINSPIKLDGGYLVAKNELNANHIKNEILVNQLKETLQEIINDKKMRESFRKKNKILVDKINIDKRIYEWINIF